jgi:hypothetical protein
MADAPATATAPVQGTDKSIETAVSNQTPAEPNKTTETKDQFAEKLELLSRKERAIYKAKQQTAQERKQLASEKAEYEAWKAAKAKAKENPLDYLKNAELSYDDLTQFMLNGGKPTPQDEVKSLRGELEEFKKQQIEERNAQKQQAAAAQQQQEATLINDLKDEIKSVIANNSDTFELLATRGAEDEVFNHLRDSFKLAFMKWNEDGRRGPPPAPMKPEDAAKEMEEFYEKETERLAQTKKMSAKYQQAKVDPGQKKGPSPTLSNSMTTSSAASMLPAANEADRMARALAKLG